MCVVLYSAAQNLDTLWLCWYLEFISALLKVTDWHLAILIF